MDHNTSGSINRPLLRVDPIVSYREFPYACPTEQEVRQITSDRSDMIELHMVEEGRAYYLIPGTLVRVMQDDQTSGMSEVLLGGLTKPLWTYSKFLTGRPIRDIYGVVETPNTAGLIDLRDAAVARAH